MDEAVMGKVIGNHTATITAFLLVAVCISCGVTHAALQEPDLFEKAYGHYLSYEPEKAVETFDHFISQFPDSSALDAALFWRAKALMNLKRTGEAAKNFREIKERFPQSPYVVFTEKELDSLRTASSNAEQPVVIKDITAPSGDATRAEFEEKIRRLESEGHELAERLSVAEKKAKLTEKGLIKALEDKNDLEMQLSEAKKKGVEAGKLRPDAEKAQHDYAKLSAEKMELEEKLKESEGKIKGLVAEKEKNEQGLELIKKELSGKIQESQKDWAKLDAYVKQLKADNEAMQQGIRQKDKEISDAQLKVASLEKKAEDGESARKREREALDKALQEMKSLEAEKKQLTAKLEEQQRKSGEQESRMKQLISDKTALDSTARENAALLEDKKVREAKIKELEGNIQSLTAARDKESGAGKEVQDLRVKLQEQEGRYREAEATVTRLRAEKQVLEGRIKEDEQKLVKAAEAARLQGSIAESQKAVDGKQQELQQEVAALKSQIREYEKPVVRIGKDNYTESRVFNEERLSVRVKQKIAAGPDPWSRKSSLETFIAEETLYRKAGEMGISSDKSEVEAVTRKHALTLEEQIYLSKYLTVDKLYRKKAAELDVPEKDMKAYYEKNKNKFVERATGTVVGTLALRYSKTDELDKGLMAVELHREAMEGKRLEDIAKKHGGSASYREVPLETIPLWVRAKLEHLKDGELSSIISSDSEFLIMKVQPRKATPKAYHEVKPEIQMKLAPTPEKRKQVMEDWLNAIMREAEVLR